MYVREAYEKRTRSERTSEQPLEIRIGLPYSCPRMRTPLRHSLIYLHTHTHTHACIDYIFLTYIIVKSSFDKILLFWQAKTFIELNATPLACIGCLSITMYYYILRPYSRVRSNFVVYSRSRYVKIIFIQRDS